MLYDYGDVLYKHKITETRHHRRVSVYVCYLGSTEKGKTENSYVYYAER